MPNNNQTDPRRNFAPFILPWLLGALMLGVYCLTLNHWVTVLNLGAVGQVSGFIWQPQPYNPLMYLVTLPFRFLSPGIIPIALNLFSAACASLVLVILARCVAILPQDRTEPQRQREKSDFGFLTGWQSFFPPMLAVLMLGLQLAFWEHATSFTGEVFDLLLFAAIVWLMLEYRLDEKEWRLAAVAFLYGAGIAESWMFACFFPIFLAAIIWLKKLEFFNLHFLVRLVGCALVGLLFLFLLPLLAKFNPHFKLGIWDLLRPNIRMDWVMIKSIKTNEVRIHLAQASLATFLPLLLMAIRWTSGYGDNSRIGMALASNMIHFVHAAVFGVCVWVMFDPPFSPQHLLGSPALTMNFFCALSIGYCCAYFLLLFSRKPVPTRRDLRPLPIFPQALMWLCPIIVAGVFICTLFALGALIYRNKPIIREVNSDVLLKFARFTTENLPKNGAVVLCDSDLPGQDQPLRALVIQLALAHEGRLRDFLVLDTQSLNWPPYHQIIHERYPQTFPLIVKPSDRNAVNPLNLFAMISDLAKSNSLCYLHPSYGYYFEHFYEESHGLVYPLKPLPPETILPPPLDKTRIAENEAFWSRVVESLDDQVQKALKPTPTGVPTLRKPIEWLLIHLHPVPEANQNAIYAGMFCSRCLNDWGVQLQRAGELEKAARRFTEAKRLNPDNVVADINLAFNKTLSAGAPIEINPAQVNADRFGKYRNWNTVVTANGPFDDASFCLQAGYQFAQSGFFRQAAKEYTRVRQLAPGDLFTRLQLAWIYVVNRLPDRALDALNDPLADPAKFGLDPNNSQEFSMVAASAYFQKNELAAGSRLLEKEANRHPDDEILLKAITQAYVTHGLYTNALQVINMKLARTPDDVTWLFGKGYASIQIGAYGDSIKAMTRVLELQTNDPTARFNRALAYFQSGKLDEARADYTILQAEHTNVFQIAYGLGEIAWRKKENAEALRNYQIYLANAPTNAPEFGTVRERVTQLGGK